MFQALWETALHSLPGAPPRLSIHSKRAWVLWNPEVSEKSKLKGQPLQSLQGPGVLSP